jgi:D-glycero-D-manno-heptose 1,7-bisphosphate phosphatase
MIIWTGSLEREFSKVLFLDRDGVINRDRADYVKHRSELEIYPDALDALRLLNRHEISVVLISNQSALNRGYTTPAEFWEIHQAMVSAIRRAGGDLRAALYCPHRPDENCSCRKPLPGMIVAACELFTISPQAACMIGDKAGDILAAARAGCRSILLKRPDSIHNAPLPPEVQPDAVCSGLLEAVTLAASWMGIVVNDPAKPYKEGAEES